MLFSLWSTETGVKLFMNPREFDFIRGNLIKQLLYFDEEMSGMLLEKYFPETVERVEMSALLDRYRRCSGQILGGSYQGNPDAVVLIGCTVNIQYETDGQEEAYTIVLPDYSNVDEGFISFMSPMGRRLLLSRIGDRVEVNSPSYSYTVVVKAVSYRT